MKYNKILLISRWKTLGDSVVATVLAKELKRINPDCIVHAYVPYSVAELWRMSPDIDEVIVHSRERGIKKQLAEVAAYFRFWRERYDLAVAVAKSPTVWMGFASLARKVTGNTMSRVGKLFFSDCVEKYQIRDLDTNIIKHYLYSLARVGLPVDFGATPLLKADSGVLANVKRRLDIPESYAALCITGSTFAGSGDRNISGADLLAVVSILKSRYHKIYVIGAAQQQIFIANSCKECESDIENVAGQLSLSESAALLSGCSCFVSVDTGPMHIAAALGTPIIALFGADPCHIKRCAPQNANVVILPSKPAQQIGLGNLDIEKIREYVTRPTMKSQDKKRG